MHCHSFRSSVSLLYRTGAEAAYLAFFAAAGVHHFSAAHRADIRIFFQLFFRQHFDFFLQAVDLCETVFFFLFVGDKDPRPFAAVAVNGDAFNPFFQA